MSKALLALVVLTEFVFFLVLEGKHSKILGVVCGVGIIVLYTCVVLDSRRRRRLKREAAQTPQGQRPPGGGA